MRQGGVYILALLAGILAAWAVREHIQQQEQALEVASQVPLLSRIVAAQDLAMGTRLEVTHLAQRDIPAQWAPSNSLEPGAMDSLLGAVLSVSLQAGEPILPLHVLADSGAPSLSADVALGQRAITLTAQELGDAASMLQAGDLIDVYASLKHEQRDITLVLLQRARVLRVGAALAHTKQLEAYPASITVQAHPDEVVKVLVALIPEF
jgi:pilus assembly protein CpaB